MTEPNEGIKNKLHAIEVQLARIATLMAMQYARDNHMDAPRVAAEMKVFESAMRKVGNDECT